MKVNIVTHHRNLLQNFYNISELPERQLGESCGSCYCPPTYTMGDCAPGLECKHNLMIPDAAGTCVKPGTL